MAENCRESCAFYLHCVEVGAQTPSHNPASLDSGPAFMRRTEVGYEEVLTAQRAVSAFDGCEAAKPASESDMTINCRALELATRAMVQHRLRF